MILLAAWYHIFHNLGPRFHRSHRRGVKFGAIRLLKAPIGIGASIGVGEDSWVESQDADSLLRIVRTPVAYLEGTIGTTRFGDHRLSATCLVVRIEVIGLCTILANHLVDIGSKKDISLAIGMQVIAQRIFLRFENNTIITPMTQVIDRGRPYNLVQAAVHGHQIVVRAVDIDAILSRIVGILEDVWFAIGNKLPQGKVRILCNDRCCHHSHQAHEEKSGNSSHRLL